MPPITYGDFLIRHLYEVGPAVSGGTGMVPLSWQEIDAWMRRSGVDLTPWSAQTLRSLSAAYVAEARAAEDPGREAPWKESGAHLTVAAHDLRERLRNMAQR